MAVAATATMWLLLLDAFWPAVAVRRAPPPHALDAARPNATEGTPRWLKKESAMALVPTVLVHRAYHENRTFECRCEIINKRLSLALLATSIYTPKRFPQREKLSYIVKTSPDALEELGHHSTRPEAPSPPRKP